MRRSTEVASLTDVVRGLYPPQLNAKVHLNGGEGRRETDERRERKRKETQQFGASNKTTTGQSGRSSGCHRASLFGLCGVLLGRVWRCPTYSYRAAHWRGWWLGGPFPSTDAQVSVATSSDQSIMTSWAGRWSQSCGRFPSGTSRGGTLISRATNRWMGITSGKRSPWIRPRCFMWTQHRSTGPECRRLQSNRCHLRTLRSQRHPVWMYRSGWPCPRVAALSPRPRSIRRTARTNSTQGNRLRNWLRVSDASGQHLLTARTSPVNKIPF